MLPPLIIRSCRFRLLQSLEHLQILLVYLLDLLFAARKVERTGCARHWNKNRFVTIMPLLTVSTTYEALFSISAHLVEHLLLAAWLRDMHMSNLEAIVRLTVLA